MGLFGNDKEQDERLSNMEEWLQGLTGVVQKNHLATSQLRIDLMKVQSSVKKLQSNVSEKLSQEDFDPAVIQLNDQLAKTRVKYEEAKSAAAENWASLQNNAMQALEDLDRQLQEASERMGEES